MPPSRYPPSLLAAGMYYGWHCLCLHICIYIYTAGTDVRCQSEGGRVAAAGSSAAAGCERPRRSTHSPAGTSTRLGERRHASISVGAVGPPASGAQRKLALSLSGAYSAPAAAATRPRPRRRRRRHCHCQRRHISSALAPAAAAAAATTAALTATAATTTITTVH